MHSKEQLADLHIREHVSRQKHVDELLEKAAKHVENNPEFQDDLSDFEGKRGKLAVHEIESAGPMGIWYGLINELETFIERVEK